MSLNAGPAGCGKTSTVEVLAHEAGYDITEWHAPLPTLWHEHRYQVCCQAHYPSVMINSHRGFLKLHVRHRSRLCHSLQSIAPSAALGSSLVQVHQCNAAKTADQCCPASFSVPCSDNHAVRSCRLQAWMSLTPPKWTNLMASWRMPRWGLCIWGPHQRQQQVKRQSLRTGLTQACAWMYWALGMAPCQAARGTAHLCWWTTCPTRKGLHSASAWCKPWVMPVPPALATMSSIAACQSRMCAMPRAMHRQRQSDWDSGRPTLADAW